MCSDEDIPDQQHVGDCAGGDGEEDVALPEVEAGGDEDADELRQAVAVAAEGDGSQAVDDQHRKNGAGQNFPEILHECRCLSVLIEDQKRYEPRQLRAEHAQGDGDDLLGKSYCRYAPYLAVIGFLRKDRAASLLFFMDLFGYSRSLIFCCRAS